MLLKLSGLIQYHKGELHDAAKDFSRAVELAPQDQEARNNLLLVTRELDRMNSGKALEERNQ